MVIGVVYWTLTIGFLVGALTRLLYPKLRDNQIFSITVTGVLGSVTAGWLGERLGMYNFGDNNGLIASLIGSIFAVCIYSFYSMRKSKVKNSRRSSYVRQ